MLSGFVGLTNRKMSSPFYRKVVVSKPAATAGSLKRLSGASVTEVQFKRFPKASRIQIIKSPANAGLSFLISRQHRTISGTVIFVSKDTS